MSLAAQKNKLKITKQWRLANKEHTKLYNKSYKDKHKEKNNSNSKSYARSPAGRYRSALNCALVTGREFSITKEEHAQLLLRPCDYCEGPLNPTGSGLDRKNNLLGYRLSNVVPCCRVCNSAKGDHFTHVEFKVMMKALIEFRKTKKQEI